MKPAIAALALLVAAPLSAQTVQGRAIQAQPGKLYAVLFEVSHDMSGRLTQFTLSRVIDPVSGSTANVAIAIPQAFVDNARARSASPVNSGKSDHYFTYYIFDAARPADTGIDRL